ncbi:MAG: hypothetical protein JXQ29_09365, partial [Planctomycetes bacterium]|nr:hypothetical protein [Planctomycetota bacterium]
MTARTTSTVSLVDLLADDPRITAVAQALAAGASRFLGGLWGSAAALVAGLLFRQVRRQAVLVVASLEETRDALEDLQTFGLAGEDPLLLPPLATAERAAAGFDAAAFAARLVVLRELFMNPHPRLIVAPIDALLGPMVPRDRFAETVVRVRPGESLDPAAFLRRLLDREFLRVARVEAAGEVSLRGDVLDVYPWGARRPIRIELFDDEVEEIREFDPETQRSIARVTMVRFPAARAADFRREGAAAARAFLEFLPPRSLLFLRDVDRLAERVAGVRGAETAVFGADTDAVRVRLAAMPLPAGAGIINFRTTSVDVLGRTPRWPASLALSQTLETVKRLLGRNHQVHVYTPGEGEPQRLKEVLAERLPEAVGRVHFAAGRLAVGFQLRDAGVAALSHDEFLVRQRGAAEAPPERPGVLRTRPIRDFLELAEGELVVHATHGIGRFLGLDVLERAGVAEEFLAIEYRDAARLYVP